MQITTGAEADSGIRPVQEFHTSDSVVTCLCFGRERPPKPYILLAAAFEDGHSVLYRCYRTEMERSMMASDRQLPLSPMPTLEEECVEDSTGCAAAPSSPMAKGMIRVHAKLIGHGDRISSIFFSPTEDVIATVSAGRSLRIWDADSGEVLQVVTDSCALEAAAFFPLRQDLLVTANVRGSLRIINTASGSTAQRLKVSPAARALVFDSRGEYLFAGSVGGTVHVLGGAEVGQLKWVYQVDVAPEGIQSMALLADASDPTGNLVVRTAQWVAVRKCEYNHREAPSLVPLRQFPMATGDSCFSPGPGGGFVACCSDGGQEEASDLVVHSLRDGGRAAALSRSHRCGERLVAVAANRQNTVVASGDASGHIVLWRRFSFA